MAKINLDNYETVTERLMRFKKDYQDFRMESEAHWEGAPGNTRWVCNVKLWKHKDDPYPCSNGWAFEIDGAGMTQKAAALETCETSALGRALANIGYVGDKRVTREEMFKVKKQEVFDRIDNAKTDGELQNIYNELRQEGLAEQFLGALTDKRSQLQNSTPQSAPVVQRTPPPPPDDYVPEPPSGGSLTIGTA